MYTCLATYCVALSLIPHRFVWSRLSSTEGGVRSATCNLLCVMYCLANGSPVCACQHMDKQEVRMLLILILQHVLHRTNLRLQLMFRFSIVPVCQNAFSAQNNAFHTSHSCWRANHHRYCPCVPGTICHLARIWVPHMAM